MLKQVGDTKKNNDNIKMGLSLDVFCRWNNGQTVLFFDFMVDYSKWYKEYSCEAKCNSSLTKGIFIKLFISLREYNS